MLLLPVALRTHPVKALPQAVCCFLLADNVVVAGTAVIAAAIAPAVRNVCSLTCACLHVLQTKDKWSNTQRKLLKATLRREFTLIQRTFFIYIFRSSEREISPLIGL